METLQLTAAIVFSVAALWILALAALRRRRNVALLGVLIAVLSADGWLDMAVQAQTPPTETPAEFADAILLLFGALTATVLAAFLTWGRSRSTRTLELNDRYRLIGRLTTNGVVIVDAQGRVQWINERYTAMTGWTLEDIKGKRSFEINTKGDPELENQPGIAVIRDAVAEGRGFSTELIQRRKDGTRVTLLIAAEPLTDHKGRVTGYIGIDKDISLRRRVESESARLDEILRLLASNADQALWIFNIDADKFDMVSPGFASLYQLPAERLTSEPGCWVPRIHPDDLEEACHQAEVAKRDGSFAHEHRIVLDDGSVRWIRTSAALARRAPGEPLRMVGSAEDVTERVQERFFESRFVALADATEHAVFITNAKTGQHQYINRAGLRLTGRDAHWFARAGMRIVQVFEPADRPAVIESVKALIARGGTIERRFTILRPDGSRRRCRGVVSLIKDDQGRPESVVGIVDDLTDLIEAREAHKASEQRLRSIAEAADDIIWSYDVLAKRHDYVSPATLAILGHGPDEFYNANLRWSDMVVPEDRDHFLEQVGLAKSGKQARFEYSVRHTDGSVRHLRDSAFPIFDEQGRCVRCVGVATDVTQLRRAELELAEANRKLQTAIDTAGLGAWTRDARTGEVTVNEYYARNLGFEPGEFQPGAEWWRSRLHPADLPLVLENARKLHEGHWDAYEHLVRARHKDGSYRSILSRVVALARDEHGKPLRLAGVQLDVTDLQSLRQQLDASLTQLENAIAGADLGTWEWEPPTDRFVVNDRWAQMLGLSRDDLTGTLRDCTERMHPDDKAALEQKLQKRSDGSNRLIDQTIRMRHADGSWRHIHDRARVIETAPDGSPLRVAGTHLDITDKVLAESRLRESDAKLQLALDATQLGMWAYEVPPDGSPHIIEVNENYAAMLGFRRDEMTPTTQWWRERVHPDDLPLVIRNSENTFSGKQSGFDHLIRVRHRDGSYRHLFCRAVVTAVGDDGLPCRLAGAHLDVTEHRELSEKLNQAQKLEAVGQLAAGITHDFKNLLSAITGHIGLAQATLDHGHPASDSLETVRAAAEQARAVTSSLLELTDSRERPDRAAVSNVPDALHAALDLLELSSQSRVTIRRDIPTEPLYTRAEDTDIQRIMLNLGLNARDAVQPGGTIETSLAADEQTVTITVADTGPGVPDEIRHRIFEPFFTTKPEESGTGLGLAIVHTVVRRLGGSIEVSHGPGAVFTVRLPRAPAPAPAETHAPTPATDQRSVRLDIADEHVRRLIASGFRSAGWRVADQRDPAPPTIRVADQRTAPTPNGTPVIVLTDDHQPVPGAHAMPKPFTIKDLIAKADAITTAAKDQQAQPLEQHAP